MKVPPHTPMLYFNILQASLVKGTCEEKVGLKAKDQPQCGIDFSLMVFSKVPQ